MHAKLNKLKYLRGVKGLNIAELEHLSGVDASTISALENDRRKAQISTLGKLAKALEVPLDDLLEFHDEGAQERGRMRGKGKKKKN